MSAVPVKQAAIFSYIDPLVAIIVSVMILDESMSGVQILGGVHFGSVVMPSNF